MPVRLLLKLVLFIAVFPFAISAQKPAVQFQLGFDSATQHRLSVHMDFQVKNEGDYTDLVMPRWMPGYYQLMDYPENVSAFAAMDKDGKPLRWEKADVNTWRVYKTGKPVITVTYSVLATRNFVANPLVDSAHAFLAPPGIYLHEENQLQQPVAVHVLMPAGWKHIATGLDQDAAGKLIAPDYDVLYDSPVLLGNLDSFPVFTVKGIPHYFMAYQPGATNGAALMKDLKKIVEKATDMMGVIPYKKYVFLGIGAGRGGIEHLNSAAVGFTGDGYNTEAGRQQLLSFLAHEYFHHYNAKRIRPIELGPFDYNQENRTRLLWVAEGITSYYDELLLCRAGLTRPEQLVESLRHSLQAYESGPGRLFQSVSQASYDTWSDGPFGRTGDVVNKTISFYDKGPVLGWMLDWRIRHMTQNKRSLDDVMRLLYHRYYEKGRGYTEAEFRSGCEEIAGRDLSDFFAYVYTVETPNYPRYLGYGGLLIDTSWQKQPGGWLGFSGAEKNDTLRVTHISTASPAWKAGLLPGTAILRINDQRASTALLQSLLMTATEKQIIQLDTWHKGQLKRLSMQVATGKTQPFTISKNQQASNLAKQIFASWASGK